jgi:succinate dehydrogenase / fumarate reductase iron-sulfur subunit
MTSAQKPIALKILRFKPGVIDPAQFQHYSVSVNDEATVLDCLELIRSLHDHTLMYRHSCHHAACGTCACVINGKEALACTTRVKDLKDGELTLTPLKGFAPVGDLVVNMSAFFNKLSEQWSGLQTIEWPSSQADSSNSGTVQALENCIECGSCVSACPPARRNSHFLGPAALAAIHREMIKSPQRWPQLLKLARGERGERHCRRHLACSKVCPTGVYPARHIAEIRKIDTKEQ